MVMNKKTRRTVNKGLIYIYVLVVFAFLLLPLYWVIATSLKSNMEAMVFPPTWWPETLSLDAYVNLFTKNPDFFVFYKNNFVVALGSALLICVVAVLAGYALSRIKIKWNKWIIATLIFSQMFPIVSRLISLYGIMRSFGLLDTKLGLILAVSASQIPFSITLMASFFDNVPNALEEAAYIDGAGRIRTLVTVVMPLVVPGLIAVGIYSFLIAWDDYLHAVTLMLSVEEFTLSQGIATRYLGDSAFDWPLVNAISVIGTLPMLFVFFFFQKYMVSGLTAGAVKG